MSPEWGSESHPQWRTSEPIAIILDSTILEYVLCIIWNFGWEKEIDGVVLS